MKPQMLIERTNAQFQTTSITYNESSVTYNSSATPYGGSDRVIDIGPINSVTSLEKPLNRSVE